MLIAYAWTVMIHKWYVLVYGRRLRVPIWRLLTHDLSKLGWRELPAYARQHNGDGNDAVGYAAALNHHENVNAHHWAHWIPRSGRRLGQPLPMPACYVREMVADWLAATRTYDGAKPTSVEDWTWLQRSFKSLPLHPQTRADVLDILREVFS